MREHERNARRKRVDTLRYKKPMCKEINWYSIMDNLQNMIEECGNVAYMTEDQEILLDAFDGDSETANEFQLSFTDLSYDCEQLFEYLVDMSRCEYDGIPFHEVFDLYFPAINYEEMAGYDIVESDYIPLESYAMDLARQEAGKKLMRLTKATLIDLATTASEILRQYVGICYRYAQLGSAMNILKDQNDADLSTVKAIEEAYEKAMDSNSLGTHKWSSRLDSLAALLPDKIWAQ